MPPPALSRSTTALPLPPALRGGDPLRRGEPVRPGPPTRSTRIRRRGGREVRNDEGRSCTDARAPLLRASPSPKTPRLLPPPLRYRDTLILVLGSSSLRGAATPRPHSRLGARALPAPALFRSAPRFRDRPRDRL
ncbi:hypothetical protein NDU88_006903 [Pleurodeles waltl]|uniref:Uncharacterized protein n=1 Tax=Pleurodeles waltl TaxID=8319 RepID=A0AAV7LQG9_PLEWA|nr:hypothetical protein NDU88_006903 [Pleurodeles waltl]